MILKHVEKGLYRREQHTKNDARFDHRLCLLPWTPTGTSSLTVNVHAIFFSAAFVCEHIQLLHCILDTMRLIKAQEISAGLLKLGLTVTPDHLSRIMQVLSSTLRVFPPSFTVNL